jgi:hypothetical protein
MAEREAVTQVTENIDGAIMEEIGSPDGSHLEEVYIDEPDVSVVYDGEVIDEDEGGEEEVVEVKADDEPIVEEVETVEEVLVDDPAEASPVVDETVTGDEPAPVVEDEGASPKAEVEREAFQIRVDGQEFEVPDSYVEGDNIVIPREQFQRVVQPKLADRNVWVTERRDLLRQIDDLAPEKNPRVVKAEHLLDAVDKAFENEDSAYAFFKDFIRNRDKLILSADRAAFEAEKNQHKSTTEKVQQETAVEQLEQEMDTGLNNVLDTAKSIDAYADVDFNYVRTILNESKTAFFFRAAEDMPQFGLKKGEVGINVEKIENVIKAEAEREKKRKENSAAGRRNSAVLSDDADDPDTAPPVIEPDTPLVTDTMQEAASKDDWERQMAAIAAGR